MMCSASYVILSILNSLHNEKPPVQGNMRGSQQKGQQLGLHMRRVFMSASCLEVQLRPERGTHWAV